jgi:tripartite-type tricarboxylate transporter receptor subunit TctC
MGKSFENALLWRTKKQGIVAVSVALVFAAAAGPAKSDSIADFYSTHPITILVGFGPGGGYDTYARTIARHFGDHMPGHPNVVVQNVPGAAGLTLANALYNLDPKDGTQFGTFDRLIPLDPLLQGSQSQFDSLKFSWIGSPSNEVSACVGWHEAKAKSLDDLRTTETLMAGTGSTADATIYPKLFRAVLGLQFKVVNGYQGAADSLLAMERREVDGFCPWGWASIESSHPDWLRDHKINVFMQLGMRKDDGHPDIPLALDLAKTPADRQALELMLSPDLFARPFAAPPGVPTDRLQALRKAFAETVADPAFIADAHKAGLEVEYVSGDDIVAELRKIFATPPEVVARVKDAIK